MGHQAYEGGGGGAEWLSPLINTADLCGEAFPFNKHTELMSLVEQAIASVSISPILLFALHWLR